MKSELITALLLVALLVPTAAFAKTDSPKPADEKLDWQYTSKFSTLHDETEDLAARWPGYGGFKEAHAILAYTLNTEPHYSDRDRYDHFMDACREAANSCGGAVKYRKMIVALRSSGDQAKTYRDSANALRDGIRFLVRGNGGRSMTQDILMLGLSATRSPMSSHESAYKVLFKIASHALREARNENPQWASILTFTKKGADATKSWRNGYLVLERICFTVAHAEPNTTVFMKSLSAIADAGLDSDQDLYKVLVAGVRQYRNDVPSPSHKAIAEYMEKCADKMKTWNAARKFLVYSVKKMENVPFDTPAAKLLIQAGYDISGRHFGTDEDAYRTAVIALRLARNYDIPAHVRTIIEMTIRDADRADTWREGLRITRRGMDELLKG